MFGQDVLHCFLLYVTLSAVSRMAELHFGEMIIYPRQHQPTASLSCRLSNFLSSTNQASLGCCPMSSLACLKPFSSCHLFKAILPSYLSRNSSRWQVGRPTLQRVALTALAPLLANLSAVAFSMTPDCPGTFSQACSRCLPQFNLESSTTPRYFASFDTFIS